MTCVECNGTGVFDRIGYDEIPCPACQGDGEYEVCVFCCGKAFDEYQGHPSCGRPDCELRMQAAMDYHDEAGDR